MFESSAWFGALLFNLHEHLSNPEDGRGRTRFFLSGCMICIGSERPGAIPTGASLGGYIEMDVEKMPKMPWDMDRVYSRMRPFPDLIPHTHHSRHGAFQVGWRS